MNQSQKLKIVIILMAFFIFLAGLGFGYFVSINTKTKITNTEVNNTEISPKPPVSKFTQEEIDQLEKAETEIELEERCGNLLDIKEISSLSNSETSASEAKWSPNCKYVLWFQTFFPIVGGWYSDENEGKILEPTMTPTLFIAKDNEGLFLLNTCSGKSERIYVPKKEGGIGKINWIDNNQLSFYVDQSEFIYSLIDKKYVENKNN